MLKTLLQKNGTWLEPVLYLAVFVLAFGLFIPFLGFYWDDWPVIFYTHSGRASQLVTHFSYDRPFSVWGYWLIGRLGTSPPIWQVSALLIRWGVVVAFAWALQPLWPKHTKKVFAIAMLFAIYPGYYLQAASATFSTHLLTYLLFFISLGAMGRAAAERHNSRFFSLIAIGTAIVHMFTLEYFIGLEVIRPLYLWFLLANTKQHPRERIKKLFTHWAPYLTIWLAWFAWRLFLLKLPYEPYPLEIPQAIQADPLAGLAQFITAAVQDVVYILVSTWSEVVQPSLFNLNNTIDIVAWALVGISFVCIYFAFQLNIRPKKTGFAEGDEKQFAIQALLMGLVTLVGGLTPAWMIGERLVQGGYHLRYTLSGIFGASLIIGGLIFFIVRDERHRAVILSLLIALTIGMHIRTANEYRLDWESQRAFYWQLYWRAPDLETNTALVSFDRVTTYLSDPMTGNALNVLYPRMADPVDHPSVGLWNFELNRSLIVKRIRADELLQNDYRGLTFSAGSPDDLLFYFLPESGCLWMLSPVDAYNEYLPTENRELVSHSNVSNILDIVESSDYPPTHIFGNEPQHTWCYYFEKADLARQQGDWTQVLDLMDTASEAELGPNYGVEWLPLVEAQAATGEWTRAVETSQHVHAMHARNDSMLCATWLSIVNDADEPAAAQDAFSQVSAFANCESL